MDKKYGLLCFCRNWRNPVLWSHYAEKHTGVCYGFDVDPAKFVDVRYVSERLYPNITLDNFFNHISQAQMTDLFATKFIHWNYEEEVRLLIPIPENVPNDELHFYPFSEAMRLKQVIVGAKSEIRRDEVEAAVTEESIEIFKARLAFQRFSVVKQNDRSLW
jgi:hypothetical protein